MSSHPAATKVRSLWLAVVALSVGSVVGLATVEPDGAIESVPAAAATTTERAGTAAFTLEVRFGVGATPVTSTGEGRVDFDERAGVVTLRTPPTETIIHGGVVYTRTGDRPTWVALDAARPGGGLPGAALGNFQADPMAVLDGLQRTGVLRNVRSDGTEPVRDVPTTRWQADVDATKLVQGNRKEMVERLGIRQFRYTAWVDGDGRLRRIALVMASAALTLDMTMELFDFGVAVDVRPPPPEQVTRVG